MSAAISIIVARTDLFCVPHIVQSMLPKLASVFLQIHKHIGIGNGFSAMVDNAIHPTHIPECEQTHCEQYKMFEIVCS